MKHPRVTKTRQCSKREAVAMKPYFWEMPDTIAATYAPDEMTAFESILNEFGKPHSGPYGTQEEAMAALVKTHPEYAQAAKEWMEQ